MRGRVGSLLVKIEYIIVFSFHFEMIKRKWRQPLTTRRTHCFSLSIRSTRLTSLIFNFTYSFPFFALFGFREFDR